MRHRTHVIARDKRSSEHGPHAEMGAILTDRHPVADLQHIRVVPVTWAGGGTPCHLLFHDRHDAPGNVDATLVIVLRETVEARMDVRGRPPQVANRGRPEPGLVASPLTDAEHDRSTGTVE